MAIVIAYNGHWSSMELLLVLISPILFSSLQFKLKTRLENSVVGSAVILAVIISSAQEM